MLTLLTPTGARHQAWALCMRWMRRQTYGGPVRWVIVDDGPEPQEIPTAPAGWQIEVIRPKQLWRPGKNTQLPNLRLGLSAIPATASVAIVEDDEHYAPDYIARVAREIEAHEMVGQRLCRKYNLRTRRAKELLHPWRASLCTTAVRGPSLARLRRIAAAGVAIIDGVLWRPGLGHLFDGAYVTGIKCLPGRGGIDSGHRDTFGDIHDPNLKLLRAWIGDDDARAYEATMSAESHTTQQAAPAARRQDEISLYATQYLSPHYRMGDRRRVDVQRILRDIRALPASRDGMRSLLDIGTGRGETLGFATALGFAPVSGTEVVPSLLGGRVVYAEAHALPMADRSVDHVVCFDVLEHLTPEDLMPALREMRRVARVSVTASASERHDIRGGRELHISRRPASQWLDMIRDAWGRDTRTIGSAGASPAFQILLPPPGA
jgi:SAM-dependent methyltransferase